MAKFELLHTREQIVDWLRENIRDDMLRMSAIEYLDTDYENWFIAHDVANYNIALLGKIRDSEEHDIIVTCDIQADEINGIMIALFRLAVDVAKRERARKRKEGK